VEEAGQGGGVARAIGAVITHADSFVNDLDGLGMMLQFVIETTDVKARPSHARSGLRAGC
jgi:hypothetical protein